MSSFDTNARLGLPSDQEMSEALTPKLPAWCALSGWHFVAACGVAFFFAYHSYLHLFYSDLWGHVSYGEWILQHEKLPTEDPFVPLAAGVPVIATAWGGQVLLAWAVRLGGHEWLSHVFAVTVWLSYVLLARAFWFRTRHGGVALLAAFATWCIAWGRHAIIRPEIFGALCFAALIWLVARSRREFADALGWHALRLCEGRGDQPRPSMTQGVAPNGLMSSDVEAASKLQTVVTLTGIGVVFVAWANLHGSAIVGLAFLGCYLLGRSIEVLWRERDWSALLSDSDWRFWLLATQVALLGICCNPYGIDLLIHTLLFAGHPNLKDIVEWYPLKMVSVEGITIGASWVLGAVLFRHSRVRVKVGDVCVLAFFTWAVATKVRMVAWYAPVSMWVFAPHLADVLSRVDFDRWRRELIPVLSLRSFRWSAVIVLLAWVTMCFTPISRVLLGSGLSRETRQLYSRGTPIELTAHLREHPPTGLVFGPQWWGDWLVSQGPPQMHVMATTMSVHLLPPRVWKDYLLIANGQATADAMLTRYRANTVIIDKKMQTSLLRAISSSANWEVTYEDDVGLIAVRKGTRIAEPSEPEPSSACECEGEKEDAGQTMTEEPV